MEILQLQYFQKVAHLESITQAAKELNISQPALSIMIRRLEKELGVALFDREGRGIQINSYGVAFLEHVNKILEELEQIPLQLKELKNDGEDRVFVCTTRVILLLISKFSGFFTAFPDFHLFQTFQSREEAQENLLKGYFDFAITAPPLTHDALETVILTQDKLVIYVPLQNPLSQKNKVSLHDLKEEKWLIGAIESKNDYFEEFIQNEMGFIPKVVFKGDSEIVFNLLYENKGIAFGISSSQRQYDFSKVKMLALEEDVYTIVVGISWKKDKKLTMAATAFRDYILTQSK